MELILPLVKQGNSLCVRVPKKVADSLGVKENDMVEIDVKKLSDKVSQEYLENMLKVKKKFKELQKFSDEQIIVLATLNKIHAKQVLDRKDPEEFKKTIKKEFGEKVLENYEEFISFFEKK